MKTVRIVDSEAITQKIDIFPLSNREYRSVIDYLREKELCTKKHRGRRPNLEMKLFSRKESQQSMDEEV